MLRFLGTLVDPFQPYDSSRPPPATAWAFIRAHLPAFRLPIAVSLVLTLIEAAIEVWLIGYAGRLVDRLIAARDGLWQGLGLELVLVVGVVLLLRPLSKLVREAMDDVALKPAMEALAGWRIHRHLLGQSVGWFRGDFAGRIAAFVPETGRAATGAVYAVVHTLAFVVVYIIGSLWLMASIDPTLVLPLLVWVALYLGLMAWAVPRYRAAAARHQQAQSDLLGLLVDTYSNIDTIKLFADPRTEDREARGRFTSTRDAFLGVQRIEVTMNVAMTALGSLLMVGLIGYAILLWQGGSAPIGLIAAAVALSVQITTMGEWLLDAVSHLFGDVGALRQSLATVAQHHEVTDRADAPALRVDGGAVTFDRATHHYGRGDGGLDALSLTIAPGEKVGVVGRSGAGKSTLVNLVLRFFDLESGTIAIDGQDIAGVSQESLRRAIGMVTQDASLLHRSIRDNIAYGRTDVSDAAIEAAAEKAAASAFIASLQQGFDTIVGERGVKLSGGQRQRIALARAILKDAPILVLDEATSALDSETEAAIQGTLDAVMEGKTVIAIAHRLSTIARMDRIVVLDEGRVAEEGTHDALLARGGIYAALWARQSGGFIGDS
jgi:ATP-binding cassette subfamily B multidrug efflux pump